MSTEQVASSSEFKILLKPGKGGGECKNEKAGQSDSESISGFVTNHIFRSRSGEKSSHVGYQGYMDIILGLHDHHSASLVGAIREGLPFKAFEDLLRITGIPQKELGDVLSIPTSTLNRRKKSGKFLADESDRVVRIARLLDAATAMTQGDKDTAREWLTTPLDIFNNETPLVHSNTEVGARDVEALIGRIRHGVFS